jgi:hypothetical protein
MGRRKPLRARSRPNRTEIISNSSTARGGLCSFRPDGQAKEIHLTAKGHGMAEIMCSARETGIAGNEGNQRDLECAEDEANRYVPEKCVADFGVAAALGWFGCLV